LTVLLAGFGIDVLVNFGAMELNQIKNDSQKILEERTDSLRRFIF